jgi:hypothetical protein
MTDETDVVADLSVAYRDVVTALPVSKRRRRGC